MKFGFLFLFVIVSSLAWSAEDLPANPVDQFIRNYKVFADGSIGFSYHGLVSEQGTVHAVGVTVKSFVAAIDAPTRETIQFLPFEIDARLPVAGTTLPLHLQNLKVALVRLIANQGLNISVELVQGYYRRFQSAGVTSTSLRIADATLEKAWDMTSDNEVKLIIRGRVAVDLGQVTESGRKAAVAVKPNQIGISEAVLLGGLGLAGQLTAGIRIHESVVAEVLGMADVGSVGNRTSYDHLAWGAGLSWTSPTGVILKAQVIDHYYTFQYLYREPGSDPSGEARLMDRVHILQFIGSLEARW